MENFNAKQFLFCAYFLIILFQSLTYSKNLQLGTLKPLLGTIKVLEFEPTPEDFYREFIRQSKPVLIRTRNPSWKQYFSLWKKKNFLKANFGEAFGRVYKRVVWSQGWPVETRMKFDDFLSESSKSKQLYWDSEFPLNNSLLQNLPLPLFLQCSKFQNWFKSGVLLYTTQNSSSVFHQDGAENFFFQISGKKTWLIANHSFSKAAHADEYDVLPGLSPIDPDNVDLIKFPLAANIDFYKVTTEPGDFLYVPEYWWHQVRSFDAPVIAVGIWSEVFSFPAVEIIEEVNAYTEKFAELRQLEPNEISCDWQTTNLFDAKNAEVEHFFSNKVKNRFIYFGCDEGAFYCVDTHDGSVVWVHFVQGDAGSTPVVDKENKCVYFADEVGKVYAFSALFGELLWSTNLKDGVVSALKLSKDETILFVASLDKHFYALNKSSGVVLWKQGPFGGEIWSTPTIIDNNILLTIFAENGDPAAVVMINGQIGKILWKYSPSSRPVFATPVINVEKMLAYVINDLGQIHTINLNDGSLEQVIYESGENCEGSPLLNPKTNRLYFVSVSGILKCVETKFFDLVWERTFVVTSDDNVMSSPLLSLDTNTLFAAIGENLYALNADTGDIIWQYHDSGSFISSPRIDQNEILYIGSIKNKLLALNSADGSLKWFLKTGGPVVSSVAMTRYWYGNETVGALL